MNVRMKGYIMTQLLLGMFSGHSFSSERQKFSDDAIEMTDEFLKHIVRK